MRQPGRSPVNPAGHLRSGPVRWSAVAVSWLVAAAFVIGAAVVSFLVVAHRVAEVTMPKLNNDLSDIVPSLAAAFFGCMSGALAGALGGLLALAPAIWWLNRIGALGARLRGADDDNGDDGDGHGDGAGDRGRRSGTAIGDGDRG